MKSSGNTMLYQQQQDVSDCGVICLSNILTYYKSYFPLEGLRQQSGTNSAGTTMLGLLQCAQKLGFEADGFEAEIQHLKECEDTCILHILKDGVLQHYVVFYHYNVKTNCFLIGDPAELKPRYIDENELSELWQSKALLLLKPTDKLPKTKKQSKIKWVLASLKEDSNILLMALILGIAVAILSLSTAVFSQIFIDTLLPNNDFLKIVFGSLLLLFLLLVNGFFNYIKELFLIRQGRDYNIRIIHFFYTKLMRLPKQFFDTRKIGDLVARMNDTDRIQSAITSFVSSIIVNFLMVLVSSVAIFSFNVQLGLVSLVWLPIFMLIVWVYHPQILIAQRLVMQTYGQNESNYIDTIIGIEAIKANNKQNKFIANTKSIYSEYKENSYSVAKIGLKYQFVTETVGVFFVVGIIIYASYLVINEDFTSGGVIAILQLSSMLMTAVGALAILNIQFQEAKVALNRMFEYTDLDEEDTQTKTQLHKISTLELICVNFGYPGRGNLLEDISAKVQKGECLGVLGEIGSGKSTLLQIIQKFYPFNSGKIVVNEKTDLHELELSSWRECLGVVSQHTHIFTGNIYYNISLENEYYQKDIIEFCQNMGFDRYFNLLPQGYYTIIGEEGINLSGGQKQIVALARALYKKPQVLLLDEVTSAMDSKTELFIINLLKELKPKVLMIFVTHNFRTLKLIADKIISIPSDIKD